MEDVTISLCIVTYFHEKYIRQAIESALAQKVSVPFEIIVSDDCSTDKTLVIAEEYKDRVRIVRHDKNVGLARNFYDAFKSAKGKYVSLLAGDDWLLTDNYLQKHYDYLLEHPECSAVAHNIVVFDETGNELYKRSFSTKPFTLKDFCDGKETCLHYGLLKNLFTEDNLEWLYEAIPTTDEASFLYYILKNGNWGLIEDYCYAYRHIDNGNNYNSKNTAVKNYKNLRQGLLYITNNVEKVDFSKRIKKYGAVAMKTALYYIIKKKDLSVYRSLRKETSLGQRLAFFLGIFALK